MIISPGLGIAARPRFRDYTPPLDYAASGCAFAYGLRKLLSTYAGYALRVRRNADDFEVEVKFDSENEVSLASAIVDGGTELTGSVTGGTYSGVMTLGGFAGSDTVYVVKWYDQSGNGRDAFQLTENNQPVLIWSGSMASDGIDFTGLDSPGDDRLQANYNLTTSNDHTFHAVVKTDDAGVYGVMGDLDSYNDGAELLTLSGAWSYRIDNTDIDIAATTTNKTHLLASYETALGSNDQQLRVNGTLVQQTCTETTVFNTSNRIRVGCRLTGDNDLNGRVSEIMAWNSKVTTAHQTRLVDETIAYYSLPAAPYSGISLHLDGVDDYVALGSPSTGTGAKTISMWINPDTLSDGPNKNRVMSNTNNTDWGLQIADDGSDWVLQAWSGAEGWVDLFNLGDPRGVWTHLVIVFDGSENQQAYKNGVAGSNAESPYDLSALGAGAKLSNTYGKTFDGKIDEVAIWNSALTSGQITTIYNGGDPADISSLSPLSWWRFGEGDAFNTGSGYGPELTDIGSASNTATVVNGAVFTLDSPSY